MSVKIKELGVCDSWSRPLYKDQDGNYFCDVNLGSSETPDIHYKQSKEGEPEWRVDPKKIEIVKLGK